MQNLTLQLTSSLFLPKPSFPPFLLFPHPIGPPIPVY